MDPPYLRTDESIRVMCAECGEIIEVADPAEIIRALHLLNACKVKDLLAPQN